MIFSSMLFIFLFLPLVLFIYYISGQRVKNIVLLIASLIFYAWGEPYYVFLMLLSTIINYALGILMEASVTKNRNSKLILLSAIFVDLGILMFYKYANFFMSNVNSLLDILRINFQFNNSPIHLPIGISFYTFHSLSYIIDIYRKKEKAQRNLLDLALYISFFPQLVAGPIIKYHEISKQLTKRTVDSDKFAYGIERFIFGLGKKLIIADTLGGVADKIFALNTSDLTFSISWLGLICYTFQIYFDFSAYSDMAIGLAKMFGFDFNENFNYPYVSRSIQEFWRRWHISLSTWFRDYLYIPLGGSREGKLKTYRNVIIVFLLCGFWHGASWNFIIWGLYYGIILVAERTSFGTLIKKMWRPFQHIYAVLLVMIGWVFFRADNLLDALNYIKALIGFGHGTSVKYYASMYINFEIIIILLIAVICSTPIISKIFSYRNNESKYKYIINAVHMLTTFTVFFLAVLYLSPTLQNSVKVPFIYFKF